MIYMVEDDLDIQEAMSDILRDSGLEVMLFDNSKRLTEFSIHQPPEKDSLILLDLMTPEMSGPEYLECRSQQEECWRSVPVIAMSASVVALRNLPAGQKYLSKPFSVDALFRSIQSAQSA